MPTASPISSPTPAATAIQSYDILFVEDEPTLRSAVLSQLNTLGMSVVATDDADTAIRNAEQHDFSAIVLDVRLGRHDGFSLAHKLQQFTSAPILFISGASNAEIRAQAFEQGFASDFLIKPFAMSEFVARLRAMLRRHRRAGRPNSTAAARENPVVYQIDDMELDTATLTLRRGNSAPQQMSQSLYRLLVTFIKAPNQTISKRDLLKQLTADSEPANDNSLKVSITRLRKLVQELGVTDPLIVHDRAKGYSLNAQVRTKVLG